MINRLGDINRLFAMDMIRNRLDNFYRDFDCACAPRLVRSFEDTVPRTNLHEDGEAFEIRAELPGFGKEDLKVKIQGNYLEISGKRKSGAPEKDLAHRTERNIESFTRTFTLPSEVDAEKVKADLENGILCLSLPKSEAAKPKLIEINAA
jgi:HSP20 family protein